MKPAQTRFDNTPVKAEWSPPSPELPGSARVVIVGGGIAGTSLAYHFAKAGWDGVCLLEQNQISSGTTWHSAGQVGQLRSSSAQTRVNRASTDLYARLRIETGHDPGWLQCGGLQLASCRERLYQLQRNADLAEVFGVEAGLISAAECRRYWPMLHTNDLLGGVYLPGDGRVLPGECTIALAKGALQNGVTLLEQTRVRAIRYSEDRRGIKRITGVETSRGTIDTEWVVLANNIWLRQTGLTIGVDIPVYPCEHHYVITRPIEGVTRDAPCTRDPDAGLYFRALDDGGLKLGAFKKRSKPWQAGARVPDDFSFGLLEPDWPDFEEPFAAHQHRLRGIRRDQVVKFVNGPEAFTPDNQFIMGQPYLTEGLFVCGGWNSAGIACAGGAGKFAVEWIENNGMTIDLSSVDIRRFMPYQNRLDYLQTRVSEVLGLHYQMAWPGREMETARGIRSSAVLSTHREDHACLGETAGWERPLFFAATSEEARIEYSFNRQNWHDTVAREVSQCRHNLALLDQSSFGKYFLEGPDAVRVLQRVCGANLDCETGKAVYTGIYNCRGGFESDLVVVRLAGDRFYLVTSTSHQRRDFDWVTRNIQPSEQARLKDVSESMNVFSVMGPNSRDLVGRLSGSILTDGDFPFGTARQISVQGLEVLAIRISYVGELGWEFHVDVAKARDLYSIIRNCGEEYSIRPIGNYAISTMRIEKGFRALGHELSPTDTPLEAGLSFVIDWQKEFIGKSALREQKKRGPRKRLACFILRDPKIVLWGGEPISWDGRIVGYTTSGCLSPGIGVSIALGYVSRPDGKRFNRSDLFNGEFSIHDKGRRCSALASWKSPIDAAARLRD